VDPQTTLALLFVLAFALLLGGLALAARAADAKTARELHAPEATPAE
jgi:hypothetical protein